MYLMMAQSLMALDIVSTLLLLKFIPKEDLEKEGYSNYKKLFK